MKTLQILFVLAVLVTFAAWFSFQGVSQATSLPIPEVPLAAHGSQPAPVGVHSLELQGEIPSETSKPLAID